MNIQTVQFHESTGVRAEECTVRETCPICMRMGANFSLFAEIRGWQYVRCTGCGLVFLNPHPTISLLDKYYNSSYKLNAGEYQESVSRKKSWLIQLIGNYKKPPGRLLEVGCSYGYFLAAAREAGWLVEGVELSQEAAMLAKQRLGIQIIGRTLDDAKGAYHEPYDVIVAWHVIEHLIDPLHFLHEAFGLLREGGILALRTPNISSTVARLAGTNWEWLCPPEHIHLFDSGSLSMALSCCGFEIVKNKTVRGDASNPSSEIIRSRGLSLLRRQDGQSGPMIPVAQSKRYANRGWYRTAKRTIEICSQPLDWSLWPWLAEKGKEAEMVIVSRKSGARE